MFLALSSGSSREATTRDDHASSDSSNPANVPANQNASSRGEKVNNHVETPSNQTTPSPSRTRKQRPPTFGPVTYDEGGLFRGADFQRGAAALACTCCTELREQCNVVELKEHFSLRHSRLEPVCCGTNLSYPGVPFLSYPCALSVLKLS